jgi:hypothetical protein
MLKDDGFCQPKNFIGFEIWEALVRNSGCLGEPSAFFSQCLHLLVKPKILADSFREIIFGFQVANIAPKGVRQIFNVGAGGRP